MSEELHVGDFVRVTDDYFWKEYGFFKNSHWVLEKEPVRIEIIRDDHVVVDRNGRLFGPVPLGCLERVWRPDFSLNDEVVLQDDYGNFTKGTRGKVAEHICIRTGSSDPDDIMCFYGWYPNNEEIAPLPFSVAQELLVPAL